MRRRQIAALFTPADWVVVVAGLALVVVPMVNVGSHADGVVIRQAGRIVVESSLRLDRRVAVPGPLGETLVEIVAGRVRVKADPSPRQLCVKQGWLAPGEVAICLPNQVSVARGVSAYDSLNY